MKTNICKMLYATMFALAYSTSAWTQCTTPLIEQTLGLLDNAPPLSRTIHRTKIYNSYLQSTDVLSTAEKIVFSKNIPSDHQQIFSIHSKI